MQQLTTNERAAILLHLYEKFEDRHELFKIANGNDRYNKLKESSRNQTVSKWFNSEKIQEGIKAADFERRRKEEEIKERIKEELTTSGEAAATTRGPRTSPVEAVNFLDPDEFLKFANLKANEIQDEKERRSYLEMIAKLMNYKDKDEEQQEQIKAYLPMICEKCELYKRCSACSLSSCPVSL